MPATEVYVDTSALIKCYIAEAYSDEVENFLADVANPTLSSLTILEWHCALHRRERAGALNQRYRLLAEGEFARQLSDGRFRVIPVDHSLFSAARQLLEEVAATPLRAMDALHLATALACGATLLVTADRVMAQAGSLLGLTIQAFIR